MQTIVGISIMESTLWEPRAGGLDSVCSKPVIVSQGPKQNRQQDVLRGHTTSADTRPCT